MILLDTSVLIEILKDQDGALSIIEKLPEDDIAISAVTIAEIELGFNFLQSRRNQERRKRFLEFLEGEVARIIPVDREVASEYARLQAELMKKGKSLSRFDGLIAATSEVADITLVTVDNDFGKVEGLKVKILREFVGKERIV